MNTTNNLIKRVSMTLSACILLCIGILFSTKQAFAWDGTVLEAEVSSPSSGSVLLGLKGSYATQAQAALDRINEIRYEACTEGDVPDPRDSSRMLTEADYVPLVWNTNLESIARIRAAESYLTVGHRRLNGQSIWSVAYNGENSWSEDLAWNTYATKSNSMILGINQWYSEKSDWLTYKESSPRQTGHYTSLINPNYASVGLGSFFSQGNTFTNCVAGELSYYAPTNQQMLPAYDNILQKLQVASSAVTYYLGNESESITSMEAGTSTTVAPYALYSSSFLLYVTGDISYTSSDTSIATIDSSGNVNAISNGTTSLTAYLNGTALVTTDLLVQCDHSLVLDTVIQESTCVQEGTASYICRKCGESFTQAMPLAAHDYQVTSTSSDGKSTIVCSVCGCQETAQIPTSMSIFMKNDTSTSSYYYSYAPSNNPVNSNILLYAWDIDGDSGYNIANVTVSDPSILSPEKTIIASGEELKLKVKKSGIVTLTVSAVYNPSLSQSWTIRVGNQGGADLSEATVTLSTTSYTYTGSAKQPSVKVSWRGYSLTSGTDYTVSYENNINVGTAKVIVTGAGIFGGKIEKEFQITCSSHKEQTVSGQAATCTKAGYTSSKRCSVCGIILTEPTVIKALGHSYNSGVITKEPTWETTGTKVYTCTRCGNKKTETVPVLKTIHIKTQPVSVEAGLGQTVTLSVKALNAVSYQWYYS